jgi:hypothetical protein
MVLRTLAVASLFWVTVGACTEESLEPPSYELSDGAPVRIAVAASTYAPGARVELAVHNQSKVEYVWNPCMRTLEQHSPAGWEAVNEGERSCTLEGWLLRPDQRTDATTGLAASLPPGEYRLRYGFGRVAGEYTVSDHQVSTSFRVMP